MIEQLLQDVGFSERESRIYLAGLESWLAPASTIAKKAWEKRVTCYQTLQQMKSKWWIQEVKKNNVLQYEMLSPWELTSLYESRVQRLKEKVPEMVWLMNEYASKPKVEYYEGREQLKDFILSVVNEWDSFSKDQCFLSFLGVVDLDQSLEERLRWDFADQRLNSSAKTKSLVAQKVHPYIEYTKNFHEYRTVQDPIFDLANEIVVYGWDRVALLMYNTDELSAIKITSKSFHDALHSIFYTIWNSLE